MADKDETTVAAKDHAVAVRLCLEQLSDPRRQCLKDPSELAAIGFKAVHAQGLTGVQRVTEAVLQAMEGYADVAPAHNPPYITAMRLLARELPQDPAGGRVRDGLSRDDPAGGTAVRGAAGMGRAVRHQALGLPRGQPSLHRLAGCRSC